MGAETGNKVETTTDLKKNNVAIKKDKDYEDEIGKQTKSNFPKAPKTHVRNLEIGSTSTFPIQEQEISSTIEKSPQNKSSQKSPNKTPQKSPNKSPQKSPT